MLFIQQSIKLSFFCLLSIFATVANSQEKKKVVAVLALESQGTSNISDVEKKLATSVLRETFLSDVSYDVIDPGRTEITIKELESQRFNSKYIDPKFIQDYGKQFSATHLCIVELSRRPNGGILAECQLLSVELQILLAEKTKPINSISDKDFHADFKIVAGELFNMAREREIHEFTKKQTEIKDNAARIVATEKAQAEAEAKKAEAAAKAAKEKIDAEKKYEDYAYRSRYSGHWIATEKNGSAYCIDIDPLKDNQDVTWKYYEKDKNGKLSWLYRGYYKILGNKIEFTIKHEWHKGKWITFTSAKKAVKLGDIKSEKVLAVRDWAKIDFNKQ